MICGFRGIRVIAGPRVVYDFTFTCKQLIIFDTQGRCCTVINRYTFNLLEVEFEPPRSWTNSVWKEICGSRFRGNTRKKTDLQKIVINPANLALARLIRWWRGPVSFCERSKGRGRKEKSHKLLSLEKLSFRGRESGLSLSDGQFILASLSD